MWGDIFCMNLVRCADGHFFDKDRFSECPFCSNIQESNAIDSVKKFEPLDSKWYFDSLIGVGASAKVYKLTNKEKTESTAVKLIEISKRHINYENRKREVLGKLPLQYALNSCPNIVKTLKHYLYDDSDASSDSKLNILIQMEYLNPIVNYFEKTSITEKDILKLAIDICSALEYCERKNIVHRDIKPENLFIDNAGNYKLGDFGIAEDVNEIKTRSLKGTLSFIAPEVINTGDYSFQSDIYSLGIVLYKLMNDNMFPFQEHYNIDADARSELIDRRIAAEPFAPPKNASPKFSKTIMKACSFEKELRYKTATEMLKDLSLANDCSNKHLRFDDSYFEQSTFVFDDTYYMQTEKTCDSFHDNINCEKSQSFSDLDLNLNKISDSNKNNCNSRFKVTGNGNKTSIGKRLLYRMINWICFTCVMSLMPTIIFFTCRELFSPDFPYTYRSISEFILFSLSISIITIREIFVDQLWKKDKLICVLTLFINIVCLILSTVIIGIVTMNELTLINSFLLEQNKGLLYFSIILSIVSFISGTVIQIWEEL